MEPGMHLHHSDFWGMSDGGGFGTVGAVGKPLNATIVFQRWTDLHINYILGNSGTITPPSSWQVALSTTAVSSMARNSAISATVSGTNVNELASTTASGYARQAVARTINQAGIDWGTSSFDNTLSTGGTSSTADQVTFTFTGTPSPNGANSWFMGDGTTLNAGQIYVAADTAAQRNFANGDTEKVTATIKSG